MQSSKYEKWKKTMKKKTKKQYNEKVQTTVYFFNYLLLSQVTAMQDCIDRKHPA